MQDAIKTEELRKREAVVDEIRSRMAQLIDDNLDTKDPVVLMIFAEMLLRLRRYELDVLNGND